MHSVKKAVILPIVATPALLLHKAYDNFMHMPTAQGYCYIMQAHCSLTGWLEWQELKNEAGQTIRSFLFEEVLCR